jgi:hypothetical protein
MNISDLEVLIGVTFYHVIMLIAMHLTATFLHCRRTLTGSGNIRI